jgi:hypothetical protein
MSILLILTCCKEWRTRNAKADLNGNEIVYASAHMPTPEPSEILFIEAGIAQATFSATLDDTI